MNKEIIAKSKYVRISARKARLIINTVRGQNALESVTLLKFINKRAAKPIRKTIESAIANAVNNDNANKANLIITEARVDDAPVFKRGRAVSKGRYHRILKRNSHIIIKVQEKDQEKPIKTNNIIKKVVESNTSSKVKVGKSERHRSGKKMKGNKKSNTSIK